MNYLGFTHEKLNVGAISEQVSSSSCGAISMFIGTTRDSFENKTVLKLEYEAYEPMAMKQMEQICSEMRSKWTAIENVAIYHRLGAVAVKEASIVIAVSSPHRLEAMQATQWCIDSVKKSVPIWKKEVYAEESAVWKENKESQTYPPKTKKFKLDIKQEVKLPFVPSHLLQIKASSEEIERRIDKFIERKRNEINACNVRDFCTRKKADSEDSCARIDAALIKRKDSKGHLQVNRVLNTYHRDQTNSEYMTKFVPKNGVEERLENLEVQLCMQKPVPRNVYKRLRLLEERLLHLESLSLEYVQFWDKTTLGSKRSKKKIFSIQEIDGFIAQLENKAKSVGILQTAIKLVNVV